MRAVTTLNRQSFLLSISVLGNVLLVVMLVMRSNPLLDKSQATGFDRASAILVSESTESPSCSSTSVLNSNTRRDDTIAKSKETTTTAFDLSSCHLCPTAIPTPASEPSCKNCSECSSVKTVLNETNSSSKCPICQQAKSTRNLLLGEKNRYYAFTKAVLSQRAQDDLSAKGNWSSAEWNVEVVRVLHLNNVTAGNLTMVALANQGMVEMTMNWIASLKMTGYDRWVVLCFDFPLYRFLVEYGFGNQTAMVPLDWLHKNVSAAAVNWGNTAYLELLQAKIIIIIKLLKLGIYLFYLDVDLVFCSPYVLEHINFGDDELLTDLIYMVDGKKSIHMSKIVKERS